MATWADDKTSNIYKWDKKEPEGEIKNWERMEENWKVTVLMKPDAVENVKRELEKLYLEQEVSDH